MSAANRARGARAEVAVVNWLRLAGWPDARRYGSGDGRQPGDIDAWPGICVEVKDRAASAFPTWLAQAEAEAGPNRIPVVVRRIRGNPDVGAWPTVLPLDGWRALGGAVHCWVVQDGALCTPEQWLTRHPEGVLWGRFAVVRFATLAAAVAADRDERERA